MNIKKSLLNVLTTISCGALLTTPVSAEMFDVNDLARYNSYFATIQDDIKENLEAETGVLGDINHDGSIDYLDLISMKKIILSIEEQNSNADINQDGSINILDLNSLKVIVYKQSEETSTKTICLDAGHYGLYNRSPGVSAYYESNMTWKLHIYLKQELENYGFKVITTRENQATDKSLIERGQTSAGCDLFISIHSNAVGSYMSEGTDFPLAIVLLPDDSTNIDEISAEIGSRLATTVEDVMQTKQHGRTWTRLSDNDRNGDGILNDEWYGVMFGAKSVGTPAILMEHSFHTNTRSAKWLLNEDNLKKLAHAEAEVIAQYFELI